MPVFGQERPVWQDERSFILAAVGAAIGTGNVWRFPYLCFKYGGGSFLVPYCFALFVLGVPVTVLELGLGQQRLKGFVYTMHEIHPALAGLGWATVLNTFLSCVFYCLVMAWSLIYLLHSFSEPWAVEVQPSAELFGSMPTLWWLAAPITLHQDPCDIPPALPQVRVSTAVRHMVRARLIVPYTLAQDDLTVVTFFCGLEHQSLGCTPPDRQYAFGLPNTTDVYASHASVPDAVSIFAEPLWRAAYVLPYSTVVYSKRRLYCASVAVHGSLGTPTC